MTRALSPACFDLGVATRGLVFVLRARDVAFLAPVAVTHRRVVPPTP